jgi:hypothetical protein
MRRFSGPSFLFFGFGEGLVGGLPISNVFIKKITITVHLVFYIVWPWLNFHVYDCKGGSQKES